MSVDEPPVGGDKRYPYLKDGEFTGLPPQGPALEPKNRETAGQTGADTLRFSPDHAASSDTAWVGGSESTAYPPPLVQDHQPAYLRPGYASSILGSPGTFGTDGVGAKASGSGHSERGHLGKGNEPRPRTRKGILVETLGIILIMSLLMAVTLVVLWVILLAVRLFFPELGSNLLTSMSYNGRFGWPVFWGLLGGMTLTIPVGTLLFYDQGDLELGGAVFGGIVGITLTLVFGALGWMGWWPSLFLGAGWFIGYTIGAVHEWADAPPEDKPQYPQNI